MELGEGPLVLGGLLKTGVFHDCPTADDLLGLGVRPVDTGDLALADDVVHGVLRPVESATVEEDPLAGPLTDVLVHRVEQRLGRRSDALFHPHESHESGHLDHSFGLWLVDFSPICRTGMASFDIDRRISWDPQYEHGRTAASGSRPSGRRRSS